MAKFNRDDSRSKRTNSSSSSGSKGSAGSRKSDRSDSDFKKSSGSFSDKRERTSKGEGKDFSAGRKSSRSFSKDAKPERERRSSSSSKEGGFEKKPRFSSKDNSFDKKPKIASKFSRSRKSNDESSDKAFSPGERSGRARSESSGERKSFRTSDQPRERRTNKEDEGGFKRLSRSENSGERKSSFRSSDQPRERKFNKEGEGDFKRTARSAKGDSSFIKDKGFKKPFGKSDEKRPFKGKEPFDSSKPGDRKGGFKSFSKEKPSEVSRKKTFKKEFGDENIEYSTPPTYNLKPASKKPVKGGKKPSKKTELMDTTGMIRLNKYIANSGVCSRRDADLLIQTGEVYVNGKIVTELGFKVSRTDVVKYSGQVLKSEKHVYVLLNKPKDFLTTTDDPEERRTVMSLVKTACKERIYPVGRLDRQTTGLLLLTNDGDMAVKLTHPSHKTAKLYQADLDKPITAADFEALVSGLVLEDGPVHVDSAAIISADKTSIGLEIHEGRNRLVRRMFEHLGYDVVKLDRVMYAGLTKKDLPRGKWRYLSEKEVIRLKHFGK